VSLDIIGDIHGQADELEALLAKLGYRVVDGAHRHPSRTAVFVGDFIDRGPRQVDTVQLVRRMVDAGSARAVMGNHELNAIAWYLPDPASPGEHLRARHRPPYGAKNRHQHAAFLREVEDRPALHRELIEWFLTLPLWLELPGLRVVHACWHPAQRAWLEGWLGPGARLTEDRMVAATRDGDPAMAAVEVLTKGIEVALPDGHVFRDSDGIERRHTRIRWWDAAARTYRDAAHLPPAAVAGLPDDPLPDGVHPGELGDTPLLVGHYWMNGRPGRLSPTVACVDYSAGKGGPLVAYRWDGEPTFDDSRFVASR
jgi:hypothetical protein